MPDVNLKITRQCVTPEQNAELIRGVTGLWTKVLDHIPHPTIVVIAEG